MSGLRILSIDHRVPLIELADRLGAPRERLAVFKQLVVDAALEIAAGREGFGVFMDGGYGAAALAKAQEAGVWAARPIDRPHARPLAFEGSSDIDAEMAQWPDGVAVKCAVYLHPQDDPAIIDGVDRALEKLHAACARRSRELLLEVLASPHGPVDERTIADLMARFYKLGVQPRWWLIEDQPGEGWARVSAVARGHDPSCRFLTIARTIEDFPAVAASARREPLVEGFCAGRCMFGPTIERWLRGNIGDEAAVAAIAARFATVVAAWEGASP